MKNELRVMRRRRDCYKYTAFVVMIEVIALYIDIYINLCYIIFVLQLLTPGGNSLLCTTYLPGGRASSPADCSSAGRWLASR